MFKQVSNSQKRYLDLMKRDPSGKLFIREVLNNTLTMAYENYHISKDDLLLIIKEWSESQK